MKIVPSDNKERFFQQSQPGARVRVALSVGIFFAACGLGSYLKRVAESLGAESSLATLIAAGAALGFGWYCYRLFVRED